MMKALLIGAGLIFAGFGTVGIFVPILPTTPFYILAALCFAKGSMRFHRWFTGTKMYRKHLLTFAQSRSMTLKAKLAILIPVSIMLMITCAIVNLPAVRIVIPVLLLVKYWYFIFIIKTKKRTKMGE